MDMVQILQHSLDRNRERLANVKDDQLGDATPCADWSVKDLINHIIGGNFLFALSTSGKTVDTSQPRPDFVGNGNFLAAYEQASNAQIEGWRTDGVMELTMELPFGTMTGKDAIRIALLEAVVHGRDLAKATGQDYSIPDEVALPMLEGLKKVMPGGKRPPQMPFGDEIAVPDGAPVGDKLVAFLGREP
jgi:uncharacterized protein (TIGR03086 family)